MAHEFELHKEIELDATPEQVWEAIATGPGIDSWFMDRNQVEPCQGGWETEYEAMKEGWDMYLHALAQYLTHFLGRAATVVSAVRPQAAAREHAWAVLRSELGLTGTVTEGDPVRLTVPGLPPAEGIVDYAGPPTCLGVRTSDGLYRFIHSGPQRGDVMIVGHHIFSDDADLEETEQAWQSWLTRLFA
jgi:hypothetical protein